MSHAVLVPGSVVRLRQRAVDAFGSGRGIVSGASRGVVIDARKPSRIAVTFPEQLWHGRGDELECISQTLLEGTLVQRNPQKGYTFHSASEMAFVSPSSVGVVVSVTQHSCRVDFQECHCVKCSFGDVLPMYRLFKLGELVRFNTLYADYKPLSMAEPLSLPSGESNTLRAGQITAIHTDRTLSIAFLTNSGRVVTKRLSYQYVAPVMCLQCYGFTATSLSLSPDSAQVNITSSITLKYTLGMKVERRREHATSSLELRGLTSNRSSASSDTNTVVGFPGDNCEIGGGVSTAESDNKYSSGVSDVAGHGQVSENIERQVGSNQTSNYPIATLSSLSSGVVSAIRRDGSILVSCASGSAFVARPHELRPSVQLSTFQVGEKVISNHYLPYSVLSLSKLPERCIGTVVRIASNGVITVLYGKDENWFGLQQELLPASYAVSNGTSEPCPFEPGDKVSLTHATAKSKKRSCGVPENSVGVVCEVLTECHGDDVTKLLIVSFKESSRWIGLPSEVRRTKDNIIPGCKVRRNIWRRGLGNDKVLGKPHAMPASVMHVVMRGVGTVLRIDRDNSDIVYVRWCDGEYACSEKDLMLI